MVSEAVQLGSNVTHVLPFCTLKYALNKVRHEYSKILRIRTYNFPDQAERVLLYLMHKTK